MRKMDTLLQFLVLLSALGVIGCTQNQVGATRAPSLSSVNHSPLDELPAYIFNKLDTVQSTCDSFAENDRTTSWYCAGYSPDYIQFIKDFTRIEPSLMLRFEAKPTTKWMYFTDNGVEIDFYSRGFILRNTEMIVAYDPSEEGREIFIGMSPVALNLFAEADGRVILENDHLSESGSNRMSTPNHEGSYNCSDFHTQQEAITFFKSRGFTASYDPFGLDADNNGVPCESFGRSIITDASKCPPEKYWVASYTRSNGTKVRGHCRKRR